MSNAVNTASMAEKILERLKTAGIPVTEAEAPEIRRVCAAMHGHAENDIGWGLVIAAVAGASATGAMIGRERKALVGAMREEHDEAKAVLVEQVATLRAEVAKLMKALKAIHERVGTAGENVESMALQLARTNDRMIHEAVASTRRAALEAVEAASERVAARIERAARQTDEATTRLEAVESGLTISWPTVLTILLSAAMGGAATLFFWAK